MSNEKTYKVVNGIRFAKGVDTSGIDWDAEPDPEFLADLKKTAKIRITLMLDEDILQALKQRASAEGDGRYQTFLNAFLRNTLLRSSGLSNESLLAMIQALQRDVTEVQEALKHTDKAPKLSKGLQEKIAKTAPKGLARAQVHRR